MMLSIAFILSLTKILTLPTHKLWMKLNATDVKKHLFSQLIQFPCFEYWLLLHFIYTTEPFSGNGKS